jgi:hypothetical protein
VQTPQYRRGFLSMKVNCSIAGEIGVRDHDRSSCRLGDAPHRECIKSLDNRGDMTLALVLIVVLPNKITCGDYRVYSPHFYRIQ